MKDLKDRIMCPFCDEIADLTEIENDVFSNQLQRRVTSKVLAYICRMCDQDFTTTESDTESMRRVHANVKRESRMEKILKTRRNG